MFSLWVLERQRVPRAGRPFHLVLSRDRCSGGGRVFRIKNFIEKTDDDSHSLSLVERNSALSQVVADPDPEEYSLVHVLRRLKLLPF